MASADWLLGGALADSGSRIIQQRHGCINIKVTYIMVLYEYISTLQQARQRGRPPFPINTLLAEPTFSLNGDRLE